MTEKIIFTGGGSAGHVTLNLALIPFFLEKGWQVEYIGSSQGIEKDLIKKYPQVVYHEIATGKLRRYFSWQNFVDMVKIPLGIIQAVGIVLETKPQIIFSKGGFVSFPVVLAGKVCGVPVVMHESDLTPGLANKMSMPFISRFFTTFEETGRYVKEKSKIDWIGPVLSDRLQNGDKQKACKICGFDPDKPVLMFVGGSLGAKSLNQAVWSELDELLKKYQVIHICGRGQTNDVQKDGYRQFEFVDCELKDFMKAADVVVSRAGSNAIFELLSLAKPMILVPLPTGSSRGEQMLNAKSFYEKGYCEIIEDQKVTDPKVFLDTIDRVFSDLEKYKNNMEKCGFKSTNNSELAEKIIQISKNKSKHK